MVKLGFWDSGILGMLCNSSSFSISSSGV
ncbi:hypothetical protein M0802_016414 [Mischocyttarus mexicanus]|nr:hypothetical protein M0802_016414 [Mischocyttarus mexicanus]